MTVRWTEQPELRDPALLAAFAGWNDAANAATDVLRWLTRSFDGTEFAAVDVEEYFDFQAARPQVELVDGVVRKLTWPGTCFVAVRVPDASRDLVLGLGVEPNLRWPAFCGDVLGVARETGCSGIVTLGALLADSPHTRPVRITGSATDTAAARRLGLHRSTYEGPTGIVGVLHNAARDAGFVATSLWAPVPHYVATPPNPKSTRALLERTATLLGVPLDLTDLDTATAAWERSVAGIVDRDAEASAYVRQLEQRYDDAAQDEVATETDDEGPAPLTEEELPSAETLAADFERYLREQDDTP